MIRLNVLGGALLQRDGAPVTGRAAQRHHLGLLALLAAAPEHGATRDRLISVLWPENDSARARHRLSVALHVLRKELGRDCIITSGDGVALNPGLVWTDLGAFRQAVGEGRLEAAVTHYGGAFLEGFFLGGPPEFDTWVEAERGRLATLYRAVLERLIAEAEDGGRRSSALDWWRRLAADDPLSAPVALGFMQALAASGDTAGAVRHARAHTALVEGELGIGANPEVVQFADALLQSGDARPSGATGSGAAAANPPSGEVGTPEPSSTLPPTKERGWRRHALLVTCVGAFATFIGLGARLASKAAGPGASPGVAVVASLTAEGRPVDDALTRRLATHVHATLGWVPDLNVTVGTTRADSAMSSLRRVGRHLRAATLLELRVRHRAGRADVVARLVDLGREEILWSASWERPVGDTLHLHEELSLTVAEAVRLRVAPYQPKVYTPSERAYDRFLQGVYEHRKFTTESIWTALQRYREAWEEDPGFALAHAIAGNAYIALTILGAPAEVPFAQAREHVATALELDSTLAEAHAALGYLQIFADHDFEAGERSLRRAIMLYPTLPQAHDWYGRYALYVRDWPDVAIERARRSLELDPLNTARSHLVEWILYLARRYDRVPDQNRVTWSLDADVARMLRTSPLAEAYREMGRYEDAITEFTAMQERTAAPPSAGLAVTYARAGRVMEARAILREMERRMEGGVGSAVGIASIYANLGEPDRALASLEQGLETHPDDFVALRVDPVFDPLRTDPRFMALLRRIGLE